MSTLDYDKINEYTNIMMLKLTELLISQKKSKEMSVAQIQAMANIMTMKLILLVGPEEAINIAALLLSNAFKGIQEMKEEKEKE